MKADGAIDLSGVRWRKSSFSGGGGSNCVEVAHVGATIAVRDSRHPSGPVLSFTGPGWRAFIHGVKASESGPSRKPRRRV